MSRSAIKPRAHPSTGDLQLLASAVAGRPVGIRVACDDECLLHAYTDGRTIVLPAAASGEQGWLHVVSQALLIGAGSLQPALLRRLVARPAAARRHAWVEVLRAAELLRDRVPHFYAGTLGDAEREQAVSGSGDIPDFIGTVHPLAVLRSALNHGGFAACVARAGRAEVQAEQPMRRFGDDEATEGSTLLHLLSHPFGGRNAISDMLQQILGVGALAAKQTGAADGGDGAELPVGRIESAWRRGKNAWPWRAPQALPEPGPQHEPSAALNAHHYPEWDHATQRHRPDWVRVTETEPWRADGPRDLGAALQAPSLRLRRELAQLPLDAAMQRRQRQGSEFDVAALIDHAVALRSGHAADAPAIYRASRRSRRDLGVVVVMDASGSTDECNERGESVFEQHAGTALRLTRTLQALGDRVALCGFQSWGRHQVRMLRLKSHEEAWSGRVAERLSQLDAAGFTRTGAAVRHAHRLLRTQIRLPHRLLVLITDGLSYDSGYEGAYAEEDTRQALAEARAQGTACVCLCIGGSADATRLARVFGATQWLVVDDSAQVDARIRAVCARALAGVSRRRLAVAHAPLRQAMAA